VNTHLPKVEWVQMASIENREPPLEIDLTCSPRRLRTAGICARRTVGVDVKGSCSVRLLAS
jgi:hypothetical protein